MNIKSKVLLLVFLFFIGTTCQEAEAQSSNPWDTPQGQACFERWISESMALLNSYDGTEEFNGRKPWSINRYGLLEGNPLYGPMSVAAPDDFHYYDNNRYWWMWAHYKWDPYLGWDDPNWNGAGVPPLQSYVQDCISGRATVTSGSSAWQPSEGPQSSTTGNACGFALGSGIYAKWTSLGGQNGMLGCPVSNEIEAGASPGGTTGRFAEFSGGDGGYIIWHGKGAYYGTSFEVHGCVYKLYKSIGGTTSWLGFPVSDEYEIPGGKRSDFENGYILWDASTRVCKAYAYGAGPERPGGSSSGETSAAGPGETLIVPSNRSDRITSSTLLEEGRRYTIEASGVFSCWGGQTEGVDAVWCYATWRCGEAGEPWNQLRIDGKGMTEIAGFDIPYNPDHNYSVMYTGEGKPIELWIADAVGSSGDNYGDLTVRIIPA